MKDLEVATSLLSKGKARRAWTVDGSIVIDHIIFPSLTDLSPKSLARNICALLNVTYMLNSAVKNE